MHAHLKEEVCVHEGEVDAERLAQATRRMVTFCHFFFGREMHEINLRALFIYLFGF